MCPFLACLQSIQDPVAGMDEGILHKTGGITKKYPVKLTILQHHFIDQRFKHIFAHLIAIVGGAAPRPAP